MSNVKRIITLFLLLFSNRCGTSGQACKGPGLKAWLDLFALMLGWVLQSNLTPYISILLVILLQVKGWAQRWPSTTWVGLPRPKRWSSLLAISCLNSFNQPTEALKKFIWCQRHMWKSWAIRTTNLFISNMFPLWWRVTFY